MFFALIVSTCDLQLKNVIYAEIQKGAEINTFIRFYSNLPQSINSMMQFVFMYSIQSLHNVCLC